jgi:hypothetical protein
MAKMKDTYGTAKAVPLQNLLQNASMVEAGSFWAGRHG